MGVVATCYHHGRCCGSPALAASSCFEPWGVDGRHRLCSSVVEYKSIRSIITRSCQNQMEILIKSAHHLCSLVCWLSCWGFHHVSFHTGRNQNLYQRHKKITTYLDVQVAADKHFPHLILAVRRWSASMQATAEGSPSSGSRWCGPCGRASGRCHQMSMQLVQKRISSEVVELANKMTRKSERQQPSLFTIII